TWPLACPGCGHQHRIYPQWQRNRFSCFACGGAFFAVPSLLPLRTLPVAFWVVGAYLMTRGASARQLRVLGVSHKTALLMARTIRHRIGLSVSARRRLSSTAVASILRSLRS